MSTRKRRRTSSKNHRNSSSRSNKRRLRRRRSNRRKRWISSVKRGIKGRIAEEEPTMQVQLKEVETTSSEEASSPFGGIFAYPCSLLQYLLRAFFGWFWPALHGAFGDDGKKPQQAAAAVAPEAAAPVNSTEQGDGDDEKADNCFYMEEEVVTRVWAVRRGRPPQGAPGRPREGTGGNGGVHH